MNHDIYKRRVKDVLSKDVVSVSSGDSVHEALELMVQNRVSALPVIDARDKCIGVLSTSDFVTLACELDEELNTARSSDVTHQWLIDHLADHDMGRRRIEELMTETVESISPEATLVQASREMLRHRVHRLPVLDAKGRLLGVISTMDILQAFVETAPA